MTRWTRFAGVGTLGFVVQLATLYVLTSHLHLHHIVAVALAVEAAILHNFVWHERWTWRDRTAGTPRDAALDRFVRFNAASGLVSLFGNVGFTSLFVALQVPVLAANVAAVACLTLVNYLVADRVTYGARNARSRAAAMAGARGALVRRSFFIWMLAAVAMSIARPAGAAEPGAATIAAWHRYVAMVEHRRAAESRDTTRFLAVDFDASGARSEVMSRLRRGEILSQNVAGGTVDLDGGTISHWRGQILVPGATVAELVDIAAFRGRDMPLQDDVLAWRVLSRGDGSLRLFLKLRRREVVTVAYNTEHLVDYQSFGADRAASRSVSTRIAELRDLGTPGETEKPAGEDRGFLWRLHSYWRYEAVPGGVLVELESLTLSREIPWAIRIVAGPVVERIARESVSRTLSSLRARLVGAAVE
jgi:putative flippase GtrA